MVDAKIRFAVQAPPIDDPVAFRELARKAEDCGFFALYVADHLGATFDPFAALTAAASVTSTLRLGTYVCNAAVRDPLSLAAGAATVDVLSNGRMILGLGAGHTPAEWTMVGRSYPSAGARVRHLGEVVDVVRALLRGEVVSYEGESVHTHEAFLLSLRPVQDEIPLLIGGNGARVLDLAGRTADVVGLTGTGRTLADGHNHVVEWAPAAIDARVEAVRHAARDRVRPPVLDALVQYVAITDDRRAAAERVASRVEGLDAADAVAAPYVLVGTLDQLDAELAAHRARWGFSSYVIRSAALDAGARLIELLR